MLCTSVAYEELKETSCPLILTSCWVVLGPFLIPPGLANTSAMETEPRAFTAVQVPGFWEAGTTLTPAHGSCSQSSSVQRRVRRGTVLSAPRSRCSNLARWQDLGTPQAQTHARTFPALPSQASPTTREGYGWCRSPSASPKGQEGMLASTPRLLSLLGRARLEAGLGLSDPRSKAVFL